MSETPLVVIGVDPGKMTGIAVYSLGRFIFSDQLPASEVGHFLDGFLSETRRLYPKARIVIGCERFNVGGSTVKMTQQSDATEVTGKMRDLASKHGCTFIVQNAADAKKMGQPKILRKIGWWTKGKEHANDAAKHALLALSSASLDEYKAARFLID